MAQQVRSQLKKTLSRSKRSIEESLRPITAELEENQRTDDYAEVELKRWMSQLKQLKNQLEKAPTVDLMQDEDEGSATHLPLIQFRVIEETKGKAMRLSSLIPTVSIDVDISL